MGIKSSDKINKKSRISGNIEPKFIIVFFVAIAIFGGLYLGFHKNKQAPVNNPAGQASQNNVDAQIQKIISNPIALASYISPEITSSKLSGESKEIFKLMYKYIEAGNQKDFNSAITFYEPSFLKDNSITTDILSKYFNDVYYEKTTFYITKITEAKDKYQVQVKIINQDYKFASLDTIYTVTNTNGNLRLTLEPLIEYSKLSATPEESEPETSESQYEEVKPNQ